MDVISGRAASTLNPRARPFVPAAHRAVTGLSPERWQQLESSAWLRVPTRVDTVDDPVLPDTDSIFHAYPQQDMEKEKKTERTVVWGGEMGWGHRAVDQTVRISSTRSRRCWQLDP